LSSEIIEVVSDRGRSRPRSKTVLRGEGEMNTEVPHILKRRFLKWMSVLLVVSSLNIVGVGLAHSEVTCDEELLFTFWGSPQEKAAVESMIADFMEQYPDIEVRAQHIPNTSYAEKMSTMLASGDPPDVAYLFETQALPWAQEGRLMDLSSYFHDDPEASNRLESTYYNYGDNKTLGTNTAGETIVMYYNKALFDEAGLEYPPSKAAEAWTWDEFVEVAKKLTKDRNGNDATSPDFDPNNMETYGISFAQ
jgi:multiple sugar transport system substrate-binding protein